MENKQSILPQVYGNGNAKFVWHLTLCCEGAKLVSKIGGVQPEGFNVAFCDGRVEFVRNTIKEQTLRSLITRNGGEALPEDLDK